ncbi:DJ-1 family glyoxalase III [Parablautia muri]|uniref:DJ-1/PfpI family protein n=1 Tax=Parablautia muri TaxID=2320879 RepID=A0A9X5GS87_9FIRM|nr:DJ-1 family glyoxalase III [Parablautia muri]NBJ93024.1 DJ-1/PfpI family protein [Parablautia muri]
MSKVCVFFGTGFEEIEALTVVDILRRQGIDTKMVSIMGDKTVIGSHEIPVITDELLEDVNFNEVDMLVLPGGLGGTKNLEACEALMKQVDVFVAAGKAVGAICAAPTILGHRGHLKGKKAICYPGMEDQLEGATVTCEPAVQDGNIITGRGMGCSIAFGLALLAHLTDSKASAAMAEKIVYGPKR